MQVPVALLQAVRPQEHPGLLLGTAYATAVLSVGPFLLPAVAEEYDLGLGLASLSTAILLGGFALGSFGAGRFLRTRGRVLGVALLVAMAANALSALLPAYGLLLGLRAVEGVAIGVITWYSWSQVFGTEARMSEIAVIGPLVGLTTAPIAAALRDAHGPEGIYAALAITALVPLAFSRRSGSADPALFATRTERTTRHAPTPEARNVLLCLGLLTFGGSAVFTYGAVIAADRTTLSSQAIAWAFSINAVAAVPSARWTGRRGPAGWWIAGCGAAAAVMGGATVGALFVLALAFWGFAFWMGVPGAYALLSQTSAHPEERAGDAQAIMALGRVIGPLAGGVALDQTSAPVLGVAGGAVMALAGAGLLLVARRSSHGRDGREPAAPT